MTKKRLASLMTALTLLVGMLILPTQAAAVVRSPQSLMVDGVTVACEKYNIDGYNYFKLRDIASLLNGTDAQFSVGWDEVSGTVTVTAGGSYVPVGGELADPDRDNSATAVQSGQTILINGAVNSGLSVYNIGGSNFFKLADLGAALGFGVDYDAGTNTARITSAAQPAGSADLDAQTCAVYLSLLRDQAASIQNYTWQRDGVPSAIALCDIFGDETPELIYITAEDLSVTTLHIATCQNGAVRELYAGQWAVQAGGDYSYVLFQCQGGRTLYAFTSHGDEAWSDRILTFTETDGALTAEVLLEEFTRPSEDYSQILTRYTLAGGQVDESTFRTAWDAAEASISQVLIRSEAIYSFQDLSWLPGSDLPSASMTWSEAVELLQNGADSASKAEAVSFADFAEVSFYFSSGAGAWATDLTIHSDGTFEGSFHDSDMSGGDGYVATVYYSDFHGTFSGLQRVSDTVWRFDLAELVYDMDGEAYIEDDILWAPSEAYGIEGGSVFEVYAPGTALADLPEAFVDWISAPRAWGSDRPAALTFFGLYNVDAQCGFGS